MSKEEFIEMILNEASRCPKEWRRGQAVFNILEDDRYNCVARDVMYLDDVDCFYDDGLIGKFLDKAWERIKDCV